MKKHRFTKLHAACILAVCGILILVVCGWYAENFYSQFEEVFITVTSPLQGTDTTAVQNGFRACFVPVFSLSALFVAAAVLYSRLKIADRVSRRFSAKGRSFNAKRFFDNTFLCIGIALLATGLVYADSIFHATDYIFLKAQTTSIFEEQYVDPDSVDITPTGEKRNLIYLYLESMETTYASIEAGGKQEHNYIPRLTQLAEEETNFSENGLLGGFHSTAGSSWTSGALFSSTAGIPYYTRLKQADGEFASDITTLYDVLDKTTLAAMGYEIEGDRLALGTNLFSDVPTLAESMGFEALNAETGKHSRFILNFT